MPQNEGNIFNDKTFVFMIRFIWGMASYMKQKCYNKFQNILSEETILNEILVELKRIKLFQ